jgi:hypothetical protein
MARYRIERDPVEVLLLVAIVILVAAAVFRSIL